MKLLDLDYGYTIDEETQEVYRLKDGTLHRSSVEEYDNTYNFIKKNRSLWSDSTQVDKVPDTVIQDSENTWIDIDEDGISIYKIDDSDINFEQQIKMIFIDDLNDLQYTGISQRGKFAIVKILGLITEYVKDGEWHSDIKKFNNKMYKFTYRINDNPVIGIKKVTLGKEVKMKPKKKVDTILDF